MADTGEKKGGGMFSAKPQKGAEGPSISFLSQELTSISTRLRVLEERSTNMKKKDEIIEQNMLTSRKKYSEDVKMLKEEIDEIKHTMAEIENRIILIIKEVQLTSKKEEVETLKKYIELWEPVRFVTQNQVEKIVREIMEEEREK